MDLKHMSALNRRNLTENYGMDYWSETFNANGGKKHSFVACFANGIIGYIFASDDTIVSFAIDEPFRKFGIGKQLLSHCLNTFTSDVFLHVRKTNDGARSLYKNFDFVDNRLIEGYYTDEDAYEMVHKYNKKEYPEKSKLNVPYVKKKTEDDDKPLTDDENVEWLESRIKNMSASQLQAILGTEHDCGGSCGHHDDRDHGESKSNKYFIPNVKGAPC